MPGGLQYPRRAQQKNVMRLGHEKGHEQGRAQGLGQGIGSALE
jgi:hypothetical protein